MSNISNEVLHKEIDLIQSCISRMSNHSFIIKGWTITLISVVLAVFNNKTNIILLSLVLLIPVFSFWFIDAFFLKTERMYRELYKDVIQKRKIGDESNLYDLNPKRFKNLVGSHWSVMKSLTLRCFYGIPILLLLLLSSLQIFNSTVITKEAINAPIESVMTDKKKIIEVESNIDVVKSSDNEIIEEVTIEE